MGARTAEAIVAWIDDIKRFSSVRKVADYFGPTTCLDQSAGAARYGHITREGPSVVRRLVVEARYGKDRAVEPDGLAAHQGARRSPRIGAYCERVMHGDPGRKPEVRLRGPAGSDEPGRSRSWRRRPKVRSLDGSDPPGTTSCA